MVSDFHRCEYLRNRQTVHGKMEGRIEMGFCIDSSPPAPCPVLGLELRAPCILGKPSTTELQPSLTTCFFVAYGFRGQGDFSCLKFIGNPDTGDVQLTLMKSLHMNSLSNEIGRFAPFELLALCFPGAGG